MNGQETISYNRMLKKNTKRSNCQNAKKRYQKAKMPTNKKREGRKVRNPNTIKEQEAQKPGLFEPNKRLDTKPEDVDKQ